MISTLWNKMTVHFGSCVISLIFYRPDFEFSDSCCFAARILRCSVQFTSGPPQNKLAICLHSLLARSRHALPRPDCPPNIEGKRTAGFLSSPSRHLSGGVIYARKTLRSWPQHAFNAICLPFGPINHFGSQISNFFFQLSFTMLPSSFGHFLLPFAKVCLVWFFPALPRTFPSSSAWLMIHDCAISGFAQLLRESGKSVSHCPGFSCAWRYCAATAALRGFSPPSMVVHLCIYAKIHHANWPCATLGAS